MANQGFDAPGAFPSSFGQDAGFGEDASQSQSQTIAGDTQGSMMPPPLPTSNRRRESSLFPTPAASSNRRRESSFLVYYPPLPQPVGSDSGREEPQILDDDKYIYIEIGDVTIEALWDDSCKARILFYNQDNKPRDWVELQQHDDSADDGKTNVKSFTIRVGQDRPTGNINTPYRGFTTSTITNVDNFGKQVADRPRDWHFYVTGLLTVLRNAAHTIELKNQRIEELSETVDQSQAVDGVSRDVYQAKCKEFKKLEKAMTQLQASEEGRLAGHPTYKAMVAERNAAILEVDELKERLENMVDAAAFDALNKKFEKADGDADAWYHKYNREVKDHDDTADGLDELRKAKDQEVERLQQRFDEMALSLQEAQRENKVCLTKILSYEPTYKAYSFLQRERHERLDSHQDRSDPPPARPDPSQGRPDYRRDNDRRTRQGTSPLRDPRDARVSRDRFFQNLGTGPARTAPADFPPQAPNPYGAAPSGPHTFSPPPPDGPPGGVYPPGMAPTSYKMPDITEFRGDSDQDYERWRETAVDKCSTIPDPALRVVYLKRYIAGKAWPIIKKMKATNFMDYLDALDGTYLTYDQFGEAETALMDGSLRQKSGETFAAWQARFLGVANVLHTYPTRTLVKKARGLMNTRLGNAMATVPNDNETLAEFLRRARSVDEASQDVQIGKATTAASSTTKPRRRAPGDRSPERKQRSNRHTERKVQDARTVDEKRKLREHDACYKCGKKGHTQFDKDAPCRGKPITPSGDIPFLAALDVDDEDEDTAEEYNDVVGGTDDEADF
ncbi:hypothetical protein J4E86_002764 [Alternaria arbusti]|uniref:uncharacterized protein n=1 Tax=Alternaria arbusti TaxID=232088 RepID=UPI002220E29D|nr:uncharacterized protein J4E86_002764 [Alternaria arbusti]KAI4959044.1 hypothetical protein J4E86_002764 [Alternaria arbusti]